MSKIINKPKLNQPDVEPTTTIPLVDQQEIVDFNRNHAELNLYKYGEIKIEPNVITYNGKIYVAIDSLNPTFEECIKEWEKIDFDVIKCESQKRYEISNIDETIYFELIKIKGEYLVVSHCCEFIKPEIIYLLSKTLKALERE